MNASKKWILLGFLMLIPILVKMLLSNIGKHLAPKAEIWLFLTLVALFVISVAVPKEQKKWLKWFPILFFLLAFTAQFCKKSPEPKTQDLPITMPITQTTPAPQTNSSQVIKTNWGYVVEFTGHEFEGIKVLTAETESQVTIRWIPGGKIDNPEGKSHTDPYGGESYDPSWKNRFRFSWCLGVKPHAVLILIKKSGETLESVRQEDILFFNKGEKEIKFRMNAGEELLLYYHDVDDEWYFRRNGEDGSYMRFEVEI